MERVNVYWPAPLAEASRYNQRKPYSSFTKKSNKTGCVFPHPSSKSSRVWPISLPSSHPKKKGKKTLPHSFWEVFQKAETESGKHHLSQQPLLQFRHIRWFHSLQTALATHGGAYVCAYMQVYLYVCGTLLRFSWPMCDPFWVSIHASMRIYVYMSMNFDSYPTHFNISTFVYSCIYVFIYF